MADGPKPAYIYKLVPSSAPPSTPLPDALPVSDLDRTDDFIHLSTAVQVPITLKRFFADDPKVYVLRIAYDTVEANIKWEDSRGTGPGPVGGEGIFPHLYNGLKLGREEVESVGVWENAGDGWDEALKKAEGWLVY